MPLLCLRSKGFRFVLVILMLLCLYIEFIHVSWSKKNVHKHFDTQKQRKETVLAECRKSKFVHRGNNMIVVRNQSLLYCAIAKVGCTFLKRLMLTLTAGLGEYSSPFDISPSDAHFRYIETLSKVQEPLQSFMKKNFTKILFVRDPYARLFSGYVDKMFTPQTAFHQNYGRSIIRNFRENASAKSVQCGHDVRFSEFVQYVIASIKGKAKPNPHFMPMHLQCDPCTQTYDVIGRLETLRDDLRLVLTRKQWEYYLPENLKELSQFDEVRDAVSIAFNNRNAQKGCLSFHQILQRIWRRLQIRGLLSRNIDFPLNKNRSRLLNRETFQQILNIALLKSWQDHSTKHNRADAMVEAFKTLPRKDLHELSRLLKVDCRMFGYDTHPDSIFKPKVSGDSDFQFFNFIPA